MRVHGWCTGCQRIRRVQVQRVGRNVAIGVCDDCTDAQLQRKQPHE